MLSHTSLGGGVSSLDQSHEKKLNETEEQGRTRVRNTLEKILSEAAARALQTLPEDATASVLQNLRELHMSS